MSATTNTDPANCFVGLDISLAETHVCVLDASGSILAERKVSSDPDRIADYLATAAPQAVLIGLETGATTPWLWHELRERGLPVVCPCSPRPVDASPQDRS